MSCAVCSGVGAAFNIICLVMCFAFPAKSRAAAKQTDTDSSSSGLFGCFRKGGNLPITADSPANKDVEASTQQI